MSNYRAILCASDFSEDADTVVQRAVALAEQNGSTLHLAHVVEPLSLAYGGDIPLDYSDVQEQLQQQAEAKMQEVANRHGLSAGQCHIVTGRPDHQIHQLSESLNIDLIVVGSHGRKGLALLLGSTANGVLHGAHCDVLAVRVGK